VLKRVPVVRIALIVASVLLAGVNARCASTEHPPTAAEPDTARYWPDTAWQRVAPEKLGFNAQGFASAMQSLSSGQIGGLHALIVVRHGAIAGEWYDNPSRRQQVHTLQSVSKSVTSLLIGVAIDRQLISSADSPLLSFFSQYPVSQTTDARKRALTVRHLLTMRSGMAFNENPYAGSPLQQMNDCQCDWWKFVLESPMATNPGDTWLYNSGGVVLLGGVLRAATGTPADAFATAALFQPIGIRSSFWSKGMPDGAPHLGGGLALRAEDIARIGHLVLRDGNWNGQQVISRDWIRASTARTTTGVSGYFPRNVDYGLLWWLFPRNNQSGASSNDDYIVAASGTGGQWLFIDRAKDLVVVMNGDLTSGNWAGLQFFFERILPTVR
jgi:CubicO group peptidase (beta-lactamase class C family)